MTARVTKKNATVEAVLRTGHENKDGNNPVRIRVTYDRKAKYYPVNFEGEVLYISKHDFERIKKAQRLNKDEKKIREAWEDTSALARDAINKVTQNGRPFSFDRFESEFIQQESKKGFLKIFSDHLNELRKEGRIGTYNGYKAAFVAFNKFRKAVYELKGRESILVKPGNELSPVDLTPELLRKFEGELKESGAGKNTIAIYMRSLKVIYNICLIKNPSLAEYYPFAKKQNDKGKYQIKTGSGKKGDALSIDELRKFLTTETRAGLPEHEAKLLWLFSFYCNGMNFRDMAYLKYENIKPDFITYIRQKTKDTEKDESPIEIPLNEKIREIIVQLGSPDKRPSAYVFNFIDKNMNPEKQDAVIKQKIKLTNKWLKRLCKQNELPEITTYWARHSYASLLKQSGTPVELISEMLGHSDIGTTKAYLKRFDIEKKRGANESIMSVLKQA